MRKTICLVLVLSVIGGIALINSGCGGGGGGIAGALFGVLVIAAIASSGGAGAAAFAASVRESGRPAIYRSIPTTKYRAVLNVNGVAVAESSSLTLSDDKKSLTFNATSNVIPGSIEYSVDIYPAGAGATTPFFKGYFMATIDNERIATNAPALDATSTAKALAFEQWRRTQAGAATETINDFNPTETLATLTTAVQAKLDTELGAPTANFIWGTAVDAEVNRIASATPVSSANSSTLSTGNMSLTIDQQWIPGQTPVPLTTQSQVTKPVGLTYTMTEMQTPTIGNYFHLHPTTATQDNSEVIQYIPNVHLLAEYTTATSTYSRQALSTSGLSGLAVDQVYGFHVNNIYGAIQITGLDQSAVAVSFKYNTTGGIDLTVQPFAARIGY